MAEFVIESPQITVNAVDLSAYTRRVRIPTTADVPEITASADVWKTFLGGLKAWTLEIEFNQDYAASKVDATLWAALGTSVTVEFTPTSSAVSATNPKYNGSAILTSYAPQDGAVGDAAQVTASFQGSGTLTRSTS